MLETVEADWQAAFSCKELPPCLTLSTTPTPNKECFQCNHGFVVNTRPAAQQVQRQANAWSLSRFSQLFRSLKSVNSGRDSHTPHGWREQVRVQFIDSLTPNVCVFSCSRPYLFLLLFMSIFLIQIETLNKLSVPVFLFLLITFNEISLKSLFPLDSYIVAWKSSDCDYRSTGPLTDSTSHESIRPYPLVGSFTNLNQLGFIHSRFDHSLQSIRPLTSIALTSKYRSWYSV